MDDQRRVRYRRHRWQRTAAAIRSYLPPLNFITLHYLYFISVCLVASVIFWGSSRPNFSISYTDSLFLVISAMTEAGLNTVNLSEMTTWQQVMLWCLIILGSSIWVSIWTVLARKHAFESRFRDIARRSHLRSPRSLDRRRTLTTDLPLVRKLNRTFGKSNVPVPTDDAGNELETRRITLQNPNTGSSRVLPISGPFGGQKLRELVPVSRGAGMSGGADETGSERVATGDTEMRDHITFAENVTVRHQASTTGLDIGSAPSRRHFTSDGDMLEEGSPGPELSHRQFLTAKKVGRNAQFHDLTTEEREHLGGTEYRALKVLAVVVPLYFCTWQILGCVALGAWIANNIPEPARANGINPWWNGIFNGASAFNNSGMSVLDANMIPYGSSYFVLVCMGTMILAGNTAYPVFLRFWLWSVLKLLELLTYEESYRNLKLTLEYILKYPRRVYTNLFPSRATWWLVFMLFVLNGTDWVAFEILNLGNPALDHVPVGSRIIDGLFQALAVRSGGFYVVSIPTLYIGLQVLYVIMMYISVYPVVITMRHSNVYEERSLGIYTDEVDSSSVASLSTSSSPRHTNAPSSIFSSALRRIIGVGWDGVGAAPQHASDAVPESRTSFISHQVRGQLSHDLWLLVVAVWAIATIETSHFLEDPATYSVFNIVFEVVSAYGCVGISVGVPFNAFSFAGGMYPGSKLVLCLVMLRGRHRGLPVALDRAVQLPGDELGRTEEEDHRIRRSMSARRPSTDYRDARDI